MVGADDDPAPVPPSNENEDGGGKKRPWYRNTKTIALSVFALVVVGAMVILIVLATSSTPSTTSSLQQVYKQMTYWNARQPCVVPMLGLDCTAAVGPKVSLTVQVMPYLQRLPATEEVTDALLHANEVMQSNAMWVAKHCDPTPPFGTAIYTDCGRAAFDIQQWFSGLTAGVGGIVQSR